MNKLLMPIFLIVLICAQTCNAEKLRPEHDIQYLGAFRVPTDSSSNYTWSWVTKHALTYNPTSGTLISSGMAVSNSANFAKITEFTVPLPTKTKTLGDMNVATTVHDWTDITQGKYNIGVGQAMLAGHTFLPAQGSQTKPKMYWLSTDWYGAPDPYTNTTVPTLGMSDLDFATPNAKGPWIIQDSTHSVSFTRTSLFLGNIPDSWSGANAPGYRLFSGQHKINNGGALGTCLWAIQPWDTDTPPSSGEINAKVLVCPGGDDDIAHRRNYTHTLFDDYSWTDASNDAVWVDVSGRSAVLITGSVSTLTAPYYGDCDAATENCQYYKNTLPGDADQVINPPLTCSGGVCDSSPDFCTTGELGDVKGEPYYRVLWLYSPDDLAAVVAGTKQPYEPQPYVVFNLEKYMMYSGKCSPAYIGGIAYDPEHQKIYIMEPRVDNTLSSYDPTPIIHVFQLTNSGAAADTTGPSSVAVSHNGQGGLSWPAATDDTEIGGYMVYRNGKPIAFTSETHWTDTVFNRFIGYPNHTYTVVSVDTVNNMAGSSTTTDTCTNGVKDVNEVGVDCGGGCPTCPPLGASIGKTGNATIHRGGGATLMRVQ